MDCCRSLYGTTPADSLIYLKLQWCSHTELLWTTTSTGCIKHTDRYPTFISTDTCIKSHMRLQCWFHSEVQHQGLIPLLRCPVGVVIFIYIYVFFQISFPSLSSKRRGLTSRCFIVFVALIIHQGDRSLSQQLLLMILSASPLSGAAACPEW